MTRTPESLYSNGEIARAFSDACGQEDILLLDGKGLKIVGKSVKSTWSSAPSSFETDDAAKTTGPHIGNWVLWTPSIDADGAWNLQPSDENSALVKVSGGLLRPFARALNSHVRDTTKISKDFQSHRDGLQHRIASAALAEDTLRLEDEAVLLVRASLPEGSMSRDMEARLVAEGAAFLEKVVHLGGKATQTLMESEA